MTIFFFDTRVSTSEIEKLIASEPALRHDGIVQAVVSRPFPVPALEEAMKRTYVVADFGSGRFLTKKKTSNKMASPYLDFISSVYHQPPS